MAILKSIKLTITSQDPQYKKLEGFYSNSDYTTSLGEVDLKNKTCTFTAVPAHVLNVYIRYYPLPANLIFAVSEYMYTAKGSFGEALVTSNNLEVEVEMPTEDSKEASIELREIAVDSSWVLDKVTVDSTIVKLPYTIKASPGSNTTIRVSLSPATTTPAPSVVHLNSNESINVKVSVDDVEKDNISLIKGITSDISVDMNP